MNVALYLLVWSFINLYVFNSLSNLQPSLFFISSINILKSCTRECMKSNIIRLP